jgi:hypothetical protein
MLIIRSTDVIHGIDIIPAGDTRLNDPCVDEIRMNDMRELAEKVLCRAEDMQHAEEGNSVFILPIPLLPQSVRELNDRFHKKMVRVI